jgi:hypothetical protein
MELERLYGEFRNITRDSFVISDVTPFIEGTNFGPPKKRQTDSFSSTHENSLHITDEPYIRDYRFTA